MPTEMNNVEQCLRFRQNWLKVCADYDEVRDDKNMYDHYREQLRIISVNETITFTNFLSTLTPAERNEYWKRLED